MNQKKITIAIDGWSSCGKSTLAKDLAKALNYIYVDSGAMYRGIALYALRHNLISNGSANTEKIIASLPSIQIGFSIDQAGALSLLLNGENVEDKIRTIEVSNVVSIISKIKEVRQFLITQQRELGKNKGIVMDGRDIGSVVFPDAELKLFLTADKEIRVQRRYDELKNKGLEISKEEVRINLKLRDEMDSNRTESPLIQVEDAIVIDNSFLSRSEQLEKSLEMVYKILNG